MDIPYGFDCYTFQKEETKYFQKDILAAGKSVNQPQSTNNMGRNSSPSDRTNVSLLGAESLVDYIKFTRKNEDYPAEQVSALGKANRLNLSEIDKRIFCGIKIQLGIGVVTSFLHKGLQYKPPIRGRSELINGSWTGIMKGLTVEKGSSISYDLAFGNFLAWDEEFPHIKFGPFLAIESKLVMLTGSSRRIEASSFGTNITREIWITILSLLLILSILASLRIYWQMTIHRDLEQIMVQICSKHGVHSILDNIYDGSGAVHISILDMLQNFFFIYTTMLLNKPSLEFDELIWPRAADGRRGRLKRANQTQTSSSRKSSLSALKAINADSPANKLKRRKEREKIAKLLESNQDLKEIHTRINKWVMKNYVRKLPTSIRILSYMWSAACLVIASIYSGEMLAVMLLHADVNIDTISQLINSKPPIEPVIRQDDFTYNLMLKSLDENMLRLHNKTRIIPRQDVYTRQFIESVSQRKVALLGDDELIETIFDLYHKYYPLHKSKMTYLQYPISIMYRKDFNSVLEFKLRSGIVQMFEMGLIHRWYQAQKDTYIQFYDTFEKKSKIGSKDSFKEQSAAVASNQKYKPLSMAQFKAFFRAMIYCILFAFIVLALEMIHHRQRVCRKGI